MNTNDIAEQNWPLDGIKIVTILKVAKFWVYHHTVNQPYYQMWIDGFVLDSFGEVALAKLNLNADDSEAERVAKLEKLYFDGSLHWLESGNFMFNHLDMNFYNSETKPVASHEYAAINIFFPVQVSSDKENENGVFSFAGEYFKQGRGQLSFCNDIIMNQDKLNSNPPPYPSVSSISNLKTKEDSSPIRICCEVTRIRKVLTRIGEAMCFATVGDATGIVEVVIFPETLDEFSSIMKLGAKLYISGILEMGEGGVRIIADRLTVPKVG